MLTADLFPPIAVSLVRFILGGLFLWSGGVKLQDLHGFTLIASTYTLVPDWAGKAVQKMTYAVPFVELLVAGLIIMWEFPVYALVAAVAQLVVYAGLIASEVIQQTDMDNCGCYGTAFETPPSWSHVVENLVFALLGIYLLAGLMTGGI
jgi:hypothetical protein